MPSSASLPRAMRLAMRCDSSGSKWIKFVALGARDRADIFAIDEKYYRTGVFVFERANT